METFYEKNLCILFLCDHCTFSLINRCLGPWPIQPVGKYDTSKHVGWNCAFKAVFSHAFESGLPHFKKMKPPFQCHQLLLKDHPEQAVGPYNMILPLCLSTLTNSLLISVCWHFKHYQKYLNLPSIEMNGAGHTSELIVLALCKLKQTLLHQLHLGHILMDFFTARDLGEEKMHWDFTVVVILIHIPHSASPAQGANPIICEKLPLRHRASIGWHRATSPKESSGKDSASVRHPLLRGWSLLCSLR